MADCVTNGVPWADGHPCEEGAVLFFYGEDTLDANKKRCRVNGVNQERVVFLNGAKAFGKDKDDYEIDVNLQDVELIDQAMSDAANKTGLPVKLVVIDPISNYWGKVSENSNAGDGKRKSAQSFSCLGNPTINAHLGDAKNLPDVLDV